jgi:hypothetical protein
MSSNPKKCKVCKSEYTPRNSLQSVCSPKCAQSHAQALRQKKERTERRIAKEKLKRKHDYVKEAQHSFNAYIRARDADLPCISCGRFHNGQYHAGHYRPTSTSPELRFHEWNVHKQCQPCNTHLHGNLVEYRINLIERIGQEKIDCLEGKHDPKHYTIQELKEIKAKYNQLTRELRKVSNV